MSAAMVYTTILQEQNLKPTKLERMLGMSSGSVRKAIERNSTITSDTAKKIHAQFPQYPLEWLVTGIGRKDTSPQPGSSALTKGVPVYDNEFSMGAVTSLFEAREDARIIAWLDLPEVIGCDAIVPARGDSMSDFIDARDWVGIKQIVDWEVLLWDYPYAIVTDELEVIKYVKKGKDEKSIVLVSHNKSYGDIEIPIRKIRQLFLVKVVLPFSKVKTII